MIDAMNYEYLLRRIYQVSRFEKKDVDADLYRELENAESIYLLELENIESKKPRLRTDNINDLAYDYRVQCRKIWNIVKDAITKGIDKYGCKFSKEEIEELQKALIEPQRLDKRDIDNAIKVAESILVKHEIFPA